MKSDKQPQSDSSADYLDSQIGGSPTGVQIEPDGPSRADTLIEKARTAKGPSRFNLRWIFLWMVAASAGLALLRAAGMLRDWPDLLVLLLGITYCFAPLLFFSIAIYFNKRALYHAVTIVVACLGIAGAFMFSAVVVAKATFADLAAAAVVGAILWSLQFASLSLVNWGVFGGRRVARRLPESVAAKKASGAADSGKTVVPDNSHGSL